MCQDKKNVRIRVSVTRENEMKKQDAPSTTILTHIHATLHAFGQNSFLVQTIHVAYQCAHIEVEA
jgi:hypothetical protein